VIAVAFAIGAIALAARRPLLAGALLGAAIGSKITFALFALAALWGLRHLTHRDLTRTLNLGVLGGLVVLVPAQLWSGPHTYSQLHQASRQVSLATPWRPLVNQLDPVFGGVVRTVLGPVALGLGVVLAVLLARRLRAMPAGLGDETDPRVAATADAARAAVLLGTAWVLTTPYSLPWYDAMIWAPLALLAGPRAEGGAAGGPDDGRVAPLWPLEAALLARLTLLTLAYVPGRVVGMSPTVERLTLDYRGDVAPWLNLAVVIAVLWWLFAPPRSRRPTAPSPTAPVPARSPR
jgi:hypothetical protein